MKVKNHSLFFSIIFEKKRAVAVRYDNDIDGKQSAAIILSSAY